jgi:uncharacterized repeat protein (TIGR04044 family)
VVEKRALASSETLRGRAWTGLKQGLREPETGRVNFAPNGGRAGGRAAWRRACCWFRVPLKGAHTVSGQPEEAQMAAITHAPHKEGEFLVDAEEKVFEDVKAAPGEKALVTFHTVPFEGSIGLVNMLQATRLMRKGFETSVLLYGPGVMLGVQRGFPKLGSEAFPGHLVVNQKIGGFMAEGGKVYACRFALSALYGQTEAALIPGIRPINPLDVLDIVLLHRKANAFILDTWTL